MANLKLYDTSTEETSILSATKIDAVELDEDGNVTIYLAPTKGKCYYLVIAKAEYDEVKNPFDLNKADGA